MQNHVHYKNNEMFPRKWSIGHVHCHISHSKSWTVKKLWYYENIMSFSLFPIVALFMGWCWGCIHRCAGSGYTSRWYHTSAAEHYCNECFEHYYRWFVFSLYTSTRWWMSISRITCFRYIHIWSVKILPGYFGVF